MANHEENSLGEQPFVLTIHGDVTVHFVDGETLGGKVMAQDAFNIFVAVDDAPLMIPRQQIRYIKGVPGQPIVSATFLEKDGATQEYVTYSSPEEQEEGTVVLDMRQPTTASTMPEPPTWIEPKTQTTTNLYSNTEEFEGTLILEAPTTGRELSEEYEGTMILTEEGESIGPERSYDSTSILDNPSDTPVPMTKSSNPANDATFILATPEPIQSSRTPAQLICKNGPHAGQVFVLTEHQTILGRAGTNQVPLVQDKEISRRHAIITMEGDKYFIQDQNSLNGTFVNDVAAVGARHLQSGDLILVGVSQLLFQEQQ